MPTIKLKLPILVKHIKSDGKKKYFLKPLFFDLTNGGNATHHKYLQAERELAKVIKLQFQGYKASEDALNKLYWFSFAPEHKFNKITFKENLGRYILDGQVSTVLFQVNHLQYVLLPGFGAFMFILPDGEGDAYIRKMVIKLFKEETQYDKDIDFKEFCASDLGEFSTELEVEVDVKNARFFDKRESNIFDFSRQDNVDEFDGLEELTKTGQNLTELYPEELDRAWFREKEVTALSKHLFSPKNECIVLIGPKGIGRHAILEEALFRYIKGHLDTSLQKPSNDHTPPHLLWKLHPNRIISGMSYVGQWQRRLESMIQYAIRPDEKKRYKIAFFIDNPVALAHIGQSQGSNMTLGDVFKPYVEKNKIQLILTATSEEWKVLQDKNRGLSSLFRPIRITPLSDDVNLQVILKKRKFYEEKYDVQISIQAINTLLELHRTFLGHKTMPGSYLSLLRQLILKYAYTTIGYNEATKIFREFSGLDMSIFSNDKTIAQGEVEKNISSRLVGQEEAVQALSNAIHLFKSGLKSPNHPISTFLFVGPTGVGKTEAAKAISKHLTGDLRQLIRFDMNEFFDSSAVNRLIGYKDFPDGVLTEKVRFHPFSILLFDEIEKANESVLNLLLQVLDEGRLTNHYGQVTDFTGTIIIMTSNLGATNIKDSLGFVQSQSDVDAIYQKAVEQFFRPEFINRIDAIIKFNFLTESLISDIARMQIQDFLQRDGFLRRNTLIDISDRALDWVAKRGYDKEMGGRALKRQIEKDLTSITSDQLIAIKENSPIVINIRLKGEHLYPEIYQLQMGQARENIESIFYPISRNSRRMLKGLQNELDKWLDEIEMEQDEEEMNYPRPIHDEMAKANWKMFDLKSSIDLNKVNIQEAILKLPLYRQADGKSNEVRLKHFPFAKLQNKAIQLSDSFFDELKDLYNSSILPYDKERSKLLDHYINAKLLSKQCEAFFRDQFNEIEISFTPVMTGYGNDKIDHLVDTYKNVLDDIGLEYKYSQKIKTLQLQAFGLYELLKEESGIHVFKRGGQLPVLIAVDIKVINQKGASTANRLTKLIRAYSNNDFCVDYRTELCIAGEINPLELKLMMFQHLL